MEVGESRAANINNVPGRELIYQQCEGGHQPADQQHQAQGQNQGKHGELDVVGYSRHIPAVKALGDWRNQCDKEQDEGSELEQPPHSRMVLLSRECLRVDKNQHLTESGEPAIACVG